MRTLRHVLIAWAVPVIALTACRQTFDLPPVDLPTVDLPPGALPWPTDSGSSGLATSQAAMAESGFLYGENARWPKDIPADLPPLEGEIRVVKVIPGIQYRIEYSSVSKQALSRYLEDLEGLDFELQYLVYSAPSVPDEQTAERIARGEWDAVDITRGPYRMRLEPGDDGASLDIDNAAFMTPGPAPQVTPTPIVWPDDIPAHVPVPASCRINSLARLGTGGYQMGFDCEDPLVQERYVEALTAAGLRETDRLVSDTGQIVDITLQDAQVSVRALGVVGAHFTIQVVPRSP